MAAFSALRNIRPSNQKKEDIMTPDQALLISMLLGRALDAILANVQAMTDQEVLAATQSEEVRTSMLLDEMRGIRPALGLPVKDGG